MPSSPSEWAARPLLAIDSSTDQAGLALYDGERTSELLWRAGRTQTVDLLAQLHRLLDLNGLSAADLGAVAVASGPGAFNSLRVGISIAKGLVLALGLPLLGVPTLDAAALPIRILGLPVVAIVAAGRGRLVWAEYSGADPTAPPTVPPANTTLDALVDHLRRRGAGPVVTGELSPDQERRVAAIPGVTVPPPALRGRRPGAVAALAWERWRNGGLDDPIALEPAYAGR